MKNAREMTLTPGGTLFVSTRREGNVYAVLDTKGENKGDRVVTLDLPLSALAVALFAVRCSA